MRSALALALVLAGCPSPHVDSGDSGGHVPACDEVDADGDGTSACDDCDDDDPSVHPGAEERCDGLDDDCDGAPAAGEVDDDGDGTLDCVACEALGFWAATRDLDGRAPLSAALAPLVAETSCSYTGSRTWMFSFLDNEDGFVTCVYTGARVAVDGGIPDASLLNTEHTWPQSEGADTEPARCDLHHLYPTVPEANNARGNHPFGEVVRNVSWQDGGSRLGDDASGAVVFEPRDAHKGNVARSMLYFALRYGKAMPADQVALFESWNAEDPPDARELARTTAIAGRQGSGNPFVACPGLVDRWAE